MKILNVEIDFDFLDADDIEKFENEAKRVVKECENNEIKTLTYAEQIRKECEIIDNFFNNVFGEGTSEKLFKGKANLMEHINAFQDIVNEKIRKQEEMNSTLKRYLPNREQRRNNKGRR